VDGERHVHKRSVNVYDVTITVGGNYYAGAASSVLAVYDPSLGFTTGGGRIVPHGVFRNSASTSSI
jgi:hypothetical protein